MPMQISKKSPVRIMDSLKRKPEWDEVHLVKALFNAARSTCVRRNVGAEIVAANGSDSIQGGYNGTPEGAINCNEGGCIRCNGDYAAGEGYELCFCEHAERNAYGRAGRRGVSTEGSTLFTTLEPCGTCLKEAMAHGTSRVVFLTESGNTDPLYDFIVSQGSMKVTKYAGSMDAIIEAREMIKNIYGRKV